MESWIYRQGRAEGVMVGQLASAREFCHEAVHHWHPRAGKKVWEAINNCTDLTALKEVTVNAAEWNPEQIRRRLMEPASHRRRPSNQ